MLGKRKLTNDELRKQLRIRKMRRKLYEMLWNKVYEGEWRPMPMPDTSSDRWWMDELKEIVNG